MPQHPGKKRPATNKSSVNKKTGGTRGPRPIRTTRRRRGGSGTSRKQ